MVGEAVVVGVRVFVGGVLLVAAIGKLRDVGAFASAIRSFRIVPRRWERPVACGVIVAELAAVLLLATRNVAPVGLILSVVLLGSFTVAMARVVARGDRVTCGCFGRSNAVVGGAQLVRNVAMIVVALLGAWTSVATPAVELPTTTAVVTVVFALLCVALVVMVDEMLAMPSSPPRAGTPRAGTPRARTERHATGPRSTSIDPPSTTPTGR
jgi:hypothetical protein